MSIRVPAGGTVSVPAGGTLRYARLPVEVLRSAALSAYAKLVYAEMALWVFQGSTCSIGMRQIAKRLGMSTSTVVDSILALQDAGFIEVARASTRGRRSIYVLTSTVFGQKQGRATEVVSAPSGGRRYASVDRKEVA